MKLEKNKPINSIWRNILFGVMILLGVILAINLVSSAINTGLISTSGYIQISNTTKTPANISLVSPGRITYANISLQGFSINSSFQQIYANGTVTYINFQRNISAEFPNLANSSYNCSILNTFVSANINPGVVYNGFDMRPNTAYCRFQNYNPYNINSTDRTLCIWANLTSLPAYLISYTGYESIYIAGTKKVYLGNALYDTGSTINANVSTQVCYSYNGTTAKFYINGTLVNGTMVIPLNHTIDDLKIGRRNDADVSTRTQGIIDELGVWNRTLSDSEIATLYNNGKGSTYSLETTTKVLNATIGGNYIDLNFTTSGQLPVTRSFIYTNELNSLLFNYKFSNGTTNIPINFSSNILGEIYDNSTINYSVLYEYNNSFIPTALELNTEVFSLNYSIDSSFTYPVAYLVYNGTSYLGTITNYGNSNIANISLQIPLNTGNKSFYWNISAIDSTGTRVSQISSIQYQQVTSVIFGICNTTNTIPILNFTSKDEDTRSNILGLNNYFNLDLKIGNYYLSSYKEYKINVSANSLAICLNSSFIGDRRMDYIIQYGATGYSNEYVNVQNSTLNTNVFGQNITLYPLNTSNSQSFLMKVYDANYLPLTNAVVEVYRRYIELGNNLLVEAPITDSLGQAITHLRKDDVMYTFIVRRDSVNLSTFSNIQAYCNILTQECIISLNMQEQTANPESFLQYGNVNYLPTYDASTHTYSVTFNTIDSSIKTFSIYGWKLTNTQNVSVCSDSLSAQSGVINCVFPNAYQNSTILINAYVNGQLLFKDYVISDYKKTDTLKNIRYIMLAFLIPFFAMFSLASGSLAIIFYILGLILGIGIFAIDTQSFLGAGSFLIWFIVAGIILIMKIMKGGIKNG